jgi:hypothetical protein
VVRCCAALQACALALACAICAALGSLVASVLIEASITKVIVKAMVMEDRRLMREVFMVVSLLR